ncbi:hypothetical protein M422DRAFT_25112 [Sphaerobolus stellatus SS14]|nr:hypothetical protein M422DRAFT_25112 [Sphaerobolus stellatus SS14]
MIPIQDALSTLHLGSETLNAAQILHVQAVHKTKRGSGYEVAGNALPAMCAYLVSKRIGKSELTLEQVVALSCLERQTFKRQLGILEDALSKVDLNGIHGCITYDDLSKVYAGDAAHLVWMAEVKDMLRYEQVVTPAMQCAIFYWVRSQVLNIETPNEEILRNTFDVPLRQWIGAWDIIERRCTKLKTRLIEGEKERALHPRTQSYTSPKKASHDHLADLLRCTPHPNVEQVSKVSKTQSMLKRKLWDEKQPGTGGSSKRHKGTHDSTSNFEEPMTPSKTKAISKSRSPRSAKLESIEADESSDEIADEPIVVLRSAVGGGYSPRNAEHPEKARAPTKASSALPIPLDSTPMTSTGVSDTSTQNTPVPVTYTPAVRRKPMPMTKAIRKPMLEEQLPRRQRRYVRAPFLDPSAYAWKLNSGDRRREQTLIQKFGDPWDTL